MWRRVSSYCTPGDEAYYPPRPFACMKADCCPAMHYRFRVTNRSGTVTACGYNIADYDSEQEGYYSTLTGSLAGRWVFTYPAGAEPVTRKSCSGTHTLSKSGFVVPAPLSEFCVEDDDYSFDCDAPEYDLCHYLGVNYCSFVNDPTTWAGSGSVSASDAAGYAYGAAQREFPGEWSDWTRGTPGGWSGLGATDSRTELGCAQTNKTLEIEFAGRIIPTLIRWRDTITPAGGGSVTYTPREILITDGAPVSVDWIAAAGTTVSAGPLAVWLPA